MNMEIIAFAYGNPRDVNTWSNVPAFAIKTLEAQGHTVHAINLYPLGSGMRFLIRISNKISRIVFGKSTMVLVENLPLWKKILDKRVKMATQKYPQSDFLLFFTYTESGHGITNIPSVLFNDFTIDYSIKNLSNRSATKLEKLLIKNQDKIIETADVVISLFPQAEKYYKERYQNNNIFAMKGHVINTDEIPDNEIEAIQRKQKSNEILFIGRKSYKAGARVLINAVEQYNSDRDNKIILNIIGMTREEVGLTAGEEIRFHGYLKKDNAEQRQMYYKCIKNAAVIINPTKNWGGISSVVEAMWLYTPVITTPYTEFVEIFGEKLDFGCYVEAENIDALVESIGWIREIQHSKPYYEICKNAHKNVSEYTWDAFAEQIIEYAKKAE
jgi:glycosyltransferase involved in cell wall biosynthesis